MLLQLSSAGVRLLPERSRIKAFRGSACPHGEPRAVNCATTSGPCWLLPKCGRASCVPGPVPSRRQAVPALRIDAGHPRATSRPAQRGGWTTPAIAAHARDARRKRAQRGSPSIATGSLLPAQPALHQAGTKSGALPTKGARPAAPSETADEGARPASWPHQARRQHAARRRPGPSTPTP